MLKKLVHRILRHRHFWREAGFDELSEIYVAMMFRSLALGLIGIFIPIFLLDSGFSLTQIASFYVFFFAARSVMDAVSGLCVARFGPKHTMVLAEALHILAAALTVATPTAGLPLLLPACMWGAGNSLFYIAFHVDFSKIKHSVHGGKELGYVTIMERIGGTAGPLIGGILATVFGPQYIFFIAIALMTFGLIPLFRTAEPTKVRQHLDFKNLNLAPLKRDFISYGAISTEQNLCNVLWPLFLALFVFTHQVYATVGILWSIGILTSIGTSFTIGKLIDKHKGGHLLRVSAVANALLYAVRPFTAGIPMTLGINVANEAITVGYRLPFFKGLYDAADELPGHRIVYIVVTETVGSVTKLLIWIHLYMFSQVLSAYQLLILGFAIAAIASLLITTERFKALRVY